MATYKDPAPMAAPSPPNAPRAPETVATSARAPPIPTSPFLTASHDKPEKMLKALANLLSD